MSESQNYRAKIHHVIAASSKNIQKQAIGGYCQYSYEFSWANQQSSTGGDKKLETKNGVDGKPSTYLNIENSSF